MKIFYFAVCCILYCGSDLITAAEIKITCADWLDVFVDGQLVGSHKDKTTAKTIAIPQDSKVVAIKCVVDGVNSQSGGIVASFKMDYPGDYITDATWKCSNQLETDWEKADFNDNKWLFSHVIGNNSMSSQKAPGLGYVTGISDHSDWIWTSGYLIQSGGDSTVYCRGYPGIKQTMDNAGRKFVLGFMQNNNSPTRMLSLLFTTSKPTSVTILVVTPLLAVTDSSYMHTVLKIRAGQVGDIILDRSLRHKYYHNVEKKSVLVISTEKVKIVGFNSEHASTDMYLALPITSLGIETDTNEYYAVCWDDASNCRILLVAGYDNTEVKITATSDINFQNKYYTKGSVITIMMNNKYESLQIGQTAKFTGTKIVTNKPMTVFSGNSRAKVHNKVYSGSSDHLVEQLSPTGTWGKLFVLTPLPYGAYNNGKTRATLWLAFYKLVAQVDGTQFTIKSYLNGILKSEKSGTINAGKAFQYDHPRGHVTVVTATKGIMVAQIATSNEGSKEHCIGDPWMNMMPAALQFARDYTVLTPQMTSNTDCYSPIHYLTIIVEKIHKDGILLDNQILQTPYLDIPSTDLVYQTVEIAYGVHRVQHNKATVSFGLYFFGYGSYDSYASMGGTRMSPINKPCQVTSATFGDGIDNDCDGKIDEEECTAVDPTKDCAPPAPINGGWEAWNKTGSCSGCVNSNGKQMETRLCNNPVPQFDGLPCTGEASREVSCICAPIDGGWSSWSALSACSVTCGSGKTSRFRTCTNPTKAHGGADCVGDATELHACTMPPCPIHGGWSSWTQWASCVCPLGETDGKQTYNRSCTNPEPQYNGKECDSSVYGPVKEENCNCPPVVCDKLPEILNGYYHHPNCSTTGRIYREECLGKCNTGYYNTADGTFKCTKYGTWSSNNYTHCQIYHCPPITPVTTNVPCTSCSVFPKILNVEYDAPECTSTGLDYNNVCNGSCNTGYNLEGHSKVKCNEVGKWQPQAFPHCKVSHCDALPVPGNGSYSPINCQTDGTDYPQFCTLMCNPYYMLEGNAVQTCTSQGKWTYEVDGTPLPFCKYGICEIMPEEGVNTTLLIPPGKLLFGIYVTYTCIEGYEKVSGDVDRYCTLTGDWSGYPLECKVVNCTFPDEPKHTVLLSSNKTEYEYNEQLKYECHLGYELLGGNKVRTCQADRSFTGSAPLCRKKLCHDLPPVPNAKMIVGSSEFLDAVTYECLEGYKHTTGNLVRHCLLSKIWNGTTPTCAEITCAPPTNIANAYFHIKERKYGSQTLYQCLEGYKKVGGEDYLVCNISGQWEGNYIQCQEMTCPPLISWTNNNTYGYNLFDKTIQQCSDGQYHVQGIATAMCLPNKEWEVVFPVCKEINCGLPPGFPNSSLTFGPTTYNSIAVYTCNDGTAQSPSYKQTSQCEADGWSLEDMICEPLLCTMRYIPATYITFSNGLEHTNVYEIACIDNYTLKNDGDTKRICMHGQWTGIDLDCQRTECTSLNDDENLESVSGHFIDDVATYKCKPYHEITSGDERRICTYKAVWTGKPLLCKETTCPSLGNTWPLIVYYDGFTIESMAFFSCAKGYSMAISEYLVQCGVNGSWIGVLPECKLIDCGSPPTICHGRAVYTGTTYLHNATLVPDDMYTFYDGDEYLVCEQNGKWHGDVPFCRLKECPRVEAPKFGRLYMTGLSIGSNVSFECEVNYTLHGEEVIICLTNQTWSSTIPVCKEEINTVAVKTVNIRPLKLTQYKKFTPAPKNNSIGAVVIGVLFMAILFLVLLIFIIIDAINLKRDFRYMRENVEIFLKS